MKLIQSSWKAIVAFFIPIIITNINDLDPTSLKKWTVSVVTAAGVWLMKNKTTTPAK